MPCCLTLPAFPTAMLRAELAGRFAERLRLDPRLLREELRRAAGAGAVRMCREQDRSRPTPNHAGGEGVAASVCRKPANLADELLSQWLERAPRGFVDGTDLQAPPGVLLKARGRLEPSALEEPLNAETRQALYESLFWAGGAAR